MLSYPMVNIFKYISLYEIMKLILSILICFFAAISTAIAQNATLNAANNAVFNSIAVTPRPVNNTSVNTNINTNISIVNVNPMIYDLNDLLKKADVFNGTLYDIPNRNPSTGISNNPNMLLFRKNTVINLNSYDIPIYRKY